MHRLRRALSVVAVVVGSALGAARSDGAIIASWDTLGLAGNEPSVSGVGSANVTAFLITRGAGLAAANAADNFNSSGWTGQAIDYIEFGFRVASGYQVDLDRLLIATRSSPTGPGTMGLFSSLDGYAASIYSFAQAPGNNYVNSDVGLAALAPVKGDFVVRLYQIGTTAANGGSTGSAGTFRIGDYYTGSAFLDIQFEGTLQTIPVAAVPEPSALALALAGIGGLGLVLSAPRRKKRA